MSAVSNTSPILNLAIIGHLDLLRNQLGEILIPPAVRDEFKLDTALPGTAEIKQAIDSGWLKIVPLQNTQLVAALTRSLDLGEAEAIALAIESDSQTILLDETEGRTAAKSLGLEPVGILGVLLKAKQRGDLVSVGNAMTTLQDEAGFFIEKALHAQILAKAGE